MAAAAIKWITSGIEVSSLALGYPRPPRAVNFASVILQFMDNYSLTKLGDHALLRGLASLVTQERNVTASLLAHIAEVDYRKLYLPAGYSSMRAYCIEELHFSEDAAYKRITAARAARRCPLVLVAVAEGSLHVSGLALLSAYLNEDSAPELLEAAAFKTCAQIEELLAQRVPKPDVPDQICALPVQPLLNVPIASEETPPQAPVNGGVQDQLAVRRVCQIIEQARVTPLAPGRFALQTTLTQETREKLRYAQELLSHELPSGEIATVLDRALDLLIEHLEKRKFAQTSQSLPRRASAAAGNRYVPAEVRRAVWQRDQGQCTFVGSSGHRCNARRFLEFDHIDEFARGGLATTEGMRLRCRAHNQYGAECTFGAGFMEQKRVQARAQRTSERAREDQEVIPYLRKLGFRMDEARRAAIECAARMPGGTLEERLRLALSSLHSRP